MPQTYTLTGPDNLDVARDGALGGNRRDKIYGRLDCSSARRALPRGYATIRVFFADEATAIAAGYRPCGTCMRAEYRAWRDRVDR
jgi:methylphosphotriester-DNA--protein-cysteine methyltransferase